MKKIIVFIATFLLILAIIFWYRGSTARKKGVAYCKGIMTQQLDEAKKSGSMPPLEVYKEQFVNCLTETGLPNYAIEEAVEQNF